MARYSRSLTRAREAGADRALGEAEVLTSQEIAALDLESDGWNGPLSGEWGGRSIPELSRRYGIDLEDGETAEAFEGGYWQTWRRTIAGERRRQGIMDAS